MTQIYTALGLMCGTSLDGIDLAIVETDGAGVVRPGPAAGVPLPAAVRDLVHGAIQAAKAWPRRTPPLPIFDVCDRVIADAHAEAVAAFLRQHQIQPDVVGFHGITVLHERPMGRTVGRTLQLGSGARLAQRLLLPVVGDFRSADVAAGGEGAPLAPVYHNALADQAQLKTPVAVLNLGGVGNITYVDHDGTLTAFDTGPGNGLIDQWISQHGLGACDHNGVLAAAGRVQDAVLTDLLSHPYFAATPPKSLDRYDFTLEPVTGLSVEDGAATLTAFTVQAVAKGFEHLPEPPVQLIVCGGGRRNPTLMAALAAAIAVPVVTAEDLGWRGDALEAEAFAYMAVRHLRGLPISFPGTTGVRSAQCGGQMFRGG